MSTRKGFLSAAASTALLAAAPASPAPSTAPSPKPSPKPSELSRLFAERMRTFDPNLTEKQLDDIAAGIEDNFKTGARVNPKGLALKNWDEPDFVFEAGA